jgi:hypothetical protein
MVPPASLARAKPFCTVSAEALTSAVVYFAAFEQRCARLRTSLATTANPRPCVRARADSTAALKARMLVRNAIPSMMIVMSAIFAPRCSRASIVSTTRSTTSLLRPAVSEALPASALASLAFSAFCRTAAVNSSILAAVSSCAAACCTVRAERSALPAGPHDRFFHHRSTKVPRLYRAVKRKIRTITVGILAKFIVSFYLYSIVYIAMR